ncbi:hypothetical protein Psuf_017790 [Phytohabitans suffuscus]|uniref:Uncharacterized protein n=1 Tax=Phytohabitans suffuscus TaxID=624315 RepID=A0A6F8YED1_9ACTN|nr:hypothetical protein Psuf_017790 [Phytohabitans suffuscus]
MPDANHDTPAAEWGRRQAKAAPPWSDNKWLRICAVLRLNVAEKATDATQAGNDTRHTEAP